jgi:hypothetical protein
MGLVEQTYLVGFYKRGILDHRGIKKKTKIFLTYLEEVLSVYASIEKAYNITL